MVGTTDFHQAEECAASVLPESEGHSSFARLEGATERGLRSKGSFPDLERSARS
jgi:hypothetical protein